MIQYDIRSLPVLKTSNTTIFNQEEANFGDVFLFLSEESNQYNQELKLFLLARSATERNSFRVQLLFERPA